MEEPDLSLTPHPIESPGHRHRKGHKPSGNSRRPNLPRSGSDPLKDKPKSSNTQKFSTTRGGTTSSTPRSASPDNKANDSSALQPQQKSKPKSSTKKSVHNSADAKPPSTRSDSRQRRSRERLDGGTADASNSKPPPREEETEPHHKEPGVDSEPIHDSAGAELLLLEHGAPRRKRRGNVDRKLTAADDKPPREERRANPERGKYWVDYAADDLTSRLTRDLRTSPYLDCIICYNPIRPLQPTWSCSHSSPIAPTEDVQGTQYCWVTLHLKCVRSWASKSIADTLKAHKVRGENKPGDWLCIGCRAKREIEPSSYRYVRHLPAPIHH